jgi:hypothetical protein
MRRIESAVHDIEDALITAAAAVTTQASRKWSFIVSHVPIVSKFLSFLAPTHHDMPGPTLRQQEPVPDEDIHDDQIIREIHSMAVSLTTPRIKKKFNRRNPS